MLYHVVRFGVRVLRDCAKVSAACASERCGVRVYCGCEARACAGAEILKRVASPLKCKKPTSTSKKMTGASPSVRFFGVGLSRLDVS